LSEEANKALVRRYYEEVLNQGNLAAIEELFAPSLIEDFKRNVTMSRAAFLRALPPMNKGQPFQQGVFFSENRFRDFPR